MVIFCEIQNSLICGDFGALVPSERKCVALLATGSGQSHEDP